MPDLAIVEVFKELPDSRRTAGQRHHQSLCLATVYPSGDRWESGISSDWRLVKLMLVTAYIVERGLILDPYPVSSKTNGITALPAIIKQMALKGVVFAFDAVSTPKNSSNDYW